MNIVRVQLNFNRESLQWVYEPYYWVDDRPLQIGTMGVLKPAHITAKIHHVCFQPCHPVGVYSLITSGSSSGGIAGLLEHGKIFIERCGSTGVWNWEPTDGTPRKIKRNLNKFSVENGESNHALVAFHVSFQGCTFKDGSNEALPWTLHVLSTDLMASHLSWKVMGFQYDSYYCLLINKFSKGSWTSICLDVQVGNSLEAFPFDWFSGHLQRCSACPIRMLLFQL